MTPSKPSKTARKKEHHALQDLGERLIELSADELAALPIDEELRDAITAAASINSRGALRRQKQLIGRLMRQSDAAAIRRALDLGNADERLARRVFAEAESWRDRVIEGGDQAVAEFRATGVDVDESLDRLLRELHKSRNERTAKHLRRTIFRVIHAALAAEARDDRISR